MSAKKYFLTIQYRLHSINTSVIIRMIESGGITIDDVPDQLKKEVEDMLDAKSDSDKAQ